MLTPVLALDLSATKAGVALPDGTLRTLEAPAGIPLGERLAWWDEQIASLLHPNQAGAQVGVVAVEGYAFGARTNNLTRIAEVVGLARLAAWHHLALFVEVSPQTLKKDMAGNGRAGKDAMIEAARARGYNPANDDEADAALLREWVLEHLEVVGNG